MDCPLFPERPWWGIRDRSGLKRADRKRDDSVFGAVHSITLCDVRCDPALRAVLDVFDGRIQSDLSFSREILQIQIFRSYSQSDPLISPVVGDEPILVPILEIAR